MTAPDRIWALQVGDDSGEWGTSKESEQDVEYLSRSHSNALVAAAWQDGCDQGRSLEKGHMGMSGPPIDVQAALDAIKAQVRREALQVKPLVWMECGENQFEQDADFVDTTQTYQIQEGVFWYGAEVNGTPCGSNEAAKAAAQADYERRILSALMDTQTEGEG